MKKYVFDLDGTLCSIVNGDYAKSEPFKERIKIVNTLFDNGNEITILTARGMNRNNNDQIKSINDFYSLTKNQLDNWGVKYHFLFLGKPRGDFYIDDKGINSNDYFTK